MKGGKEGGRWGVDTLQDFHGRVIVDPSCASHGSSDAWPKKACCAFEEKAVTLAVVQSGRTYYYHYYYYTTTKWTRCRVRVSVVCAYSQWKCLEFVVLVPEQLWLRDCTVITCRQESFFGNASIVPWFYWWPPFARGSGRLCSSVSRLDVGKGECAHWHRTQLAAPTKRNSLTEIVDSFSQCVWKANSEIVLWWFVRCRSEKYQRRTSRSGDIKGKEGKY